MESKQHNHFSIPGRIDALESSIRREEHPLKIASDLVDPGSELLALSAGLPLHQKSALLRLVASDHLEPVHHEARQILALATLLADRVQLHHDQDEDWQVRWYRDALILIARMRSFMGEMDRKA